MRYLTIAEAAIVLSLSENAVRQRIFRRQLPFKKYGRRVLIPSEELERFLEKLPGYTAVEAMAGLEEVS